MILSDFFPSRFLHLFFFFLVVATIKASWKVHGGQLTQYTHASSTTNTNMQFSVFLPPKALGESKTAVPVLYWLSGLTCTDENFAQKATSAFRAAAKEGIAIVLPDTSPRGAGCPHDKESYVCIYVYVYVSSSLLLFFLFTYLPSSLFSSLYLC